MITPTGSKTSCKINQAVTWTVSRPKVLLIGSNRAHQCFQVVGLKIRTNYNVLPLIGMSP